MARAKMELSETTLKKLVKDEATRGTSYTDGGCRGLMIWIARDGVVSFTIRQRVGAKRVFERLGTWSSAFTLAQARDACNVRRSELSINGLKPKVEDKTVAESIPMYETARRNKDAQASRRRAPLPQNWEEHIGRFKRIFADLLPLNVSQLSRNDFMTCMDKYGVQWSKQTGVDWDPRVLRPMMVCVMPMLRWYTKRFRLDTREIEDIVPADYEADTRYLYPGEWQACAPHVDALADECGLFERFVLLTCVRSETALGMRWQEISWGNWQKWKDEAGQEHNALIWIPPRERMKGRAKEGGEHLPRRVLLTGESLAVLERLRKIYEANKKRPGNEGYNGVFTQRMCTAWRSARTAMQRRIEKAAGTQPWDRMTLRHTHATYLQALGCPKRLVTMSMNHTPEKEGAAAITDRYAGADAAKRFMTNDPLAELAPWHLRFQRLLRDIERGFQSNDLTMIQEDMEHGQLSVNMRERYHIGREWITVQACKLSVVK